MANVNVLNQKKETVVQLTEKLKNAASGVLVDYKGITVAEDTALRAEMRKNGIEYAVVKNTMLRFAMNNVGYSELDERLNGTTSIAMSTDDAIAPARVVSTYAKKFNNKFEIKGGFVEGRVMNATEIGKIGEIPSKTALLAQVLGTMLAPLSSLAVVLNQIAEKDGASAAAAPAEESPVEAAPVEAAVEAVAEEAPTEAVTEEPTPVEEPAAEAAPTEESDEPAAE